MITRQTINRVFEASRLEEVIGEFVQLKRAGSNFKGLSPFADEKTPSFMVSPAKQIWKDFSSGKGGNVISFLMEHEQFSYPEAIRWLAKKYNIEVEEVEQTNEQKEQANERESMFLVSAYAKDYFHNILLNNATGVAIGLSYFKERGFLNEVIKKFELGYCLDKWTAFTDEALKKGYNIKYLEKTGLTIVREGGKQFDRFKGRVLFPIHSMSGRVLGFGGRILGNDKKVAKYLNSPESEIYQKSKILYGIYQAKQQIVRQDNCYLVEGYTDVISFHQSKIENVVASSGTALTPEQVRLIRRLTSNITVLFDGDEAGIRASLRGIDLILEQGMNVKVVMLPLGEDPDSFAKHNTDEELKKFLEQEAQDFINFKVSLLIKETKNDPVKKAGLIRDIVLSISKIPSEIQQEVYIKECSKIMDISERVLFGELAQIIGKKIREAKRKEQKETPVLQPVKQAKKHETNNLYILEKEIIRILLLYGNEEVSFTDWVYKEDEKGRQVIKKEEYLNTVSKELYLNLQEDEIEFTNPVFKKVYFELIYHLSQNGEISIDNLTTHEDQKVANLVTDILMEDEKYVLNNWERKEIFVTETIKILPKLVTDAILNIRRILIEKKVQEMIEDAKGKEDSSKKTSTELINLEEIVKYTELRKLLFDKLNRVV